MKRKYVYLYLLGLLLFSVACTGNFRDYNTDLSGITDDDLIIDDNGYGIRLGIIQQGIYFNYDYGKGKELAFPADTESERGHVQWDICMTANL